MFVVVVVVVVFVGGCVCFCLLFCGVCGLLLFFCFVFLQLLIALGTLRASLSGTFLQTLPDLVTPLKGHSLSPRSCPPTRSAPSERFRY